MAEVPIIREGDWPGVNRSVRKLASLVSRQTESAVDSAITSTAVVLSDATSDVQSAVDSLETLASDTLESLHTYESALSDATSGVLASLQAYESALSDATSGVLASLQAYESALSDQTSAVKASVAADFTYYVPYTGATGNVSLGVRSLSATGGTIQGLDGSFGNYRIGVQYITNIGGIINFDDNAVQTTGNVGIGTAASSNAYEPLIMEVARANNYAGMYLKNTSADGISRFNLGMKLAETTLGLLMQYDNGDGRFLMLNRRATVGVMDFQTTGGVGISIRNDGSVRLGGNATNYTQIAQTGDLTFVGSAGFYPRYLEQAAEPAAGTGATQCDTGEIVVWNDTDDNKVYLCINDGGTVKTVELI